jgi:putative Mg2+ transporter-C (MgtC) family protein
MAPEIIITKLTVALVLGMIIGFERVMTRNGAGMRTYGMVSMGSAIFMIMALEIGMATNSYGEVLRVLGQIVSGIGFLGVGIIYFSPKEHARVGITSAATLLVVAGMGAAVGLGFYILAIISTLFTFVTLSAALKLEKKLEAKLNIN